MIPTPVSLLGWFVCSALCISFDLAKSADDRKVQLMVLSVPACLFAFCLLTSHAAKLLAHFDKMKSCALIN